MYIYVYIYICIYVCVYVYVCVCIYIYLYIYTYVYIYIHIHMYVYDHPISPEKLGIRHPRKKPRKSREMLCSQRICSVYICTYTCTYIYIYIYMYIHIYIYGVSCHEECCAHNVYLYRLPSFQAGARKLTQRTCSRIYYTDFGTS